VRAAPSAELVDLLTRLKLATPAQLRAAHRPARRLAKDLALFDSVWVDALVQTRVLTPYQAMQINRGSGDNLRVGPFVLIAPWPAASFGNCYRARDVATGRTVRLVVVEGSKEPSATLANIEELIKKQTTIAAPHLAKIERCGRDADRIWIASAAVRGRTAKEWVARGGRMPASVVLEIARQMAATLTICERTGLLHGDISAQQLVIDPLGLVQLREAGIRSIVVPHENHAFAQAAPETIDYLAPECASGSAAASVASDIFACGALWWHLLAGRPPIAGATLADRRRAACSTRIRDIHPIAPDTPRRLVDAINLATEPAPERRPQSFATLLELLGPPSDRGQARVARYAARGASPPQRLIRHIRTIRRSPNLPTWATAVAGVMLAIAIGSWPLWTSLIVDDPPAQPRPAAEVATVPGQQSNPQQSSTPRPGTQLQKTFADPGEVTTAPALPPEEPAPVVRASANQAIAAGPNAPRERQVGSREFVLSAARAVPWSQIRPAAGQAVRSRPGERATILLPPTGATLATENVRFEDVDFVMQQPSPTTSACLIVSARTVSFLRCSLQVVAESGQPPVAIEWTPHDMKGAQGASEPRLALRECVLAGVSDAIRHTAASTTAIELADTLFQGTNALVAIDSSADAAATPSVQLEHCTVRGSACVVAWRPPPQSTTTGRLNVSVNACVFDLDARGAVLILDGGKPSAELFESITWQGSGSILAPKIPVARHRQSDETLRPPAEGRLKIEGMVRSEMGFAGDTSEGPDASRLVRWQVPLRSGQPPGIGDMPLHLPTLR
jgi:serine/threonine protein kinase